MQGRLLLRPCSSLGLGINPLVASSRGARVWEGGAQEGEEGTSPPKCRAPQFAQVGTERQGGRRREGKRKGAGASVCVPASVPQSRAPQSRPGRLRG